MNKIFTKTIGLVVGIFAALSVFAEDVYTRISTTSADGSVVKASATYASYPASKAFDGNMKDGGGRWLSTRANDMYLVWKFNEAQLVNVLKVYNGSNSKGGYDSAGRSPAAWTFSGSNDGEEWTVLDTQTNQTGWSNSGEVRTFEFENSKKYLYYKYSCTELNDAVTTESTKKAGYLQLFELEFYFVQRLEFVNTQITRKNENSFSCTTTLIGENGNVSWVLNDSTEEISGLIKENAIADDVLSFDIDNLASDKTYQLSFKLENEARTEQIPVGYIYTGVLSLTNPVDANEFGLIPGGVTVSRPNADNSPLDVAYTITCSVAGAEGGVTWEIPEIVTIPAGETSAVLPVKPIYDKNIEENINVSIAVAGSNIATESVAITIFNRDPISINDFTYSTEVALSDSIKEKIGDAQYENFPVLLRLPKVVSQNLLSNDGTDILILDENQNVLPFQVDSFDKDGTTLVWVKPLVLANDTAFVVYYSGKTNIDNASTDVWNDFTGVWHFSPSDLAADKIIDATGNGLDGVVTNTIVEYEGPFNTKAIHTSGAIVAPDYDALLTDASKFSMSGWFKLPSQTTGYSTYVSKKTGLSWSDRKGWYLEMSQSKTKSNLVYTNTKQFTIPDVSENWNYFNVIADGTKVKVFMNGSTGAIASIDYVVQASGKPVSISCSKQVSSEYRLRNRAMSAAEAALEYATIAEEAFFTYSEPATVDDSAPVLGDPKCVVSNGEYSASVELIENTCDIFMVYQSGNEAYTNAVASAAEPGKYYDDLSNVPDGKTYTVIALGVNAKGTEILKYGNVFYKGEIKIEKVSDSIEKGLVPGVFRVSREDTSYDLEVNLEISGAAVAGQTYEELPTSVIIPAGSNYVDIEVKPIIDHEIAEDIAVTISIVSGLYNIDSSAASANVNIVNLVAPAEYNVWVATEAGLASEGSNWSKGRAPISSDKILFDSDFSSVDCEWDAETVATVASWTQSTNYTGTVTIATVFPEVGDFNCLTVVGDMNLFGGAITHKEHNSSKKADYYRLRMNVGGNLLVDAAAKITAKGKGSYGPHTTHSGCTYGGSYNDASAWGSLTEPYNVGSSPAADNTYSAPAGGAIWMEVAGTTTLDGKIDSDSVSAWGKWNGYSGSGGAIYLKTKELIGKGAISADCTNNSAGSNQESGAGGRVSIVLTDSELVDFSLANITAKAGMSSYGRTGAAGTILVRSPEKPNGILSLVERSNKYGQYAYRPSPKETTSVVSGQTWVIDELVLTANAILRVPTGTTLDLRGGLSAVSTTAAASNIDDTGLLIDGGTLILPETENHVISGNWIFEPNGVTINGNLTVTGGAAVGTLLLYSNTDATVCICDLTVLGDMTVDKGASIRAIRGGYIDASANTVGGTVKSVHGGQNANSKSICAYDSVFNPSRPGAFGKDNGLVNVGGGAVVLKVDGILALNGNATATPSVRDSRCGAAGTINITAGNIVGEGTINANGNMRNYTASIDNDGAGGGGRIAIRLTDDDAVFTEEFLAKINAKGVYSSKLGAEYSSSAGTIYLQDGSQAEGRGTVIIRNTNDAGNNIAFTSIPSLKGGGENDDFRHASIQIEDIAHVKLAASFKAYTLAIEEGSTLDLNNSELVVAEASINGVHLGSGVYFPTDEEVAGYLLDTSAEATGSLRVTGSALIIIVK